MAGLGNLLENLHKGEARREDAKSDDRTSDAASTLDDVSRTTVEKFLGRVGERRATRRGQIKETNLDGLLKGTKRKFGVREDLYSLRRLSDSPSDSIRTGIGSFKASTCGTLAKTHLDEEVQETIRSNCQNLCEDGKEIRTERDQVKTDRRINIPAVDAQDIPDDKGQGELEESISPDGNENSDWEEGVFGFSEHEQATQKEWNGEVTLEAEGLTGKGSETRRKPSQRRATAKDREFAEMVHKTHLLCLLARGRIIDTASNDPLLQASILSVLPPSLGLSNDSEAEITKVLGRIVGWFSGTFRILSAGESSSLSAEELSHEEFLERLFQTVQKQVGSEEEVAGLSVALLRGLGFLTRYVRVLDVASLKPDAESLEASVECAIQSDEQGITIVSESDPEASKIASLARILARSTSHQVNNVWNSSGVSKVVSPRLAGKGQERGRRGKQGKSWGSAVLDHNELEVGASSEVGDDNRDSKVKPKERVRGKGFGRGRGKKGSAIGSNEISHAADHAEIDPPNKKRNVDDEFERQLAMAIAATASVAEMKAKALGSETATADNEPSSAVAKKLNGIKGLGHATWRQKVGLIPKEEGGGSGAVWSRKFGPVLHWAEVYCGGQGIGREWIHVDPARGIVDGADKIEGAAAACRLPLRYVVAFAGSGAKDVTRRYVNIWSRISPLRVDDGWWDATLYPLRQLESIANVGPDRRTTPGQNNLSGSGRTASRQDTETVASTSELNMHSKNQVDRSAIEDMEMETRSFTEPLPTNQQAYKTHHLYAIERWLTKYQTLHPKGPVLGYCAGHPVYPRTCVQILHTADRWLHEGFKVKSGEAPVKVIKSSRLSGKEVDSANMELHGNESKITSLYGKWQTEAWKPPTAVNGIVPKNERGQVDALSEKCIPPGTVHLRLPRLVGIAQKLEIDFAPAMVGFEARKGRSFPVYEGIVVCEEFKDLILDAYKFQEEARFSQIWKKRQENAAKRWWNLLHSMGTRQRLQAVYGGVPTPTLDTKIRGDGQNCGHGLADANVGKLSGRQMSVELCTSAKKHRQSSESQHVHAFLEENEIYDKESGVRTKKCSCGFSFHVEDM